MWNDFVNYYFWFIPPSSVLTQADKFLTAIFVAILALAIICRIAMIRVKNEINRKLLKKIWLWGLTVGLIGLAWAGFRYQNIPIFGRRIWAGVDLAMAIVWLGFVLKYVIFNFSKEKNEYERELIKNKYIPKSR